MDYLREIETAARQHGLSPELLAAQVIVESGGRADAFRFEPGILQQIEAGTLKPKRLPVNPVGRRIAASYGLLQVLWVTAADYGFSGEPESLFIPSVGLEYGAAVLADHLAWSGGDYVRALACYNGGRRGNVTPPFRNAAYAQRVLDQARTMGVTV